MTFCAFLINFILFCSIWKTVFVLYIFCKQMFVVEPQCKKTTDSISKKNKLKRNIFITTAWHHYSKFQKININNITTTFLLGYVVMRNFLVKHKMFNKNKIALFVNFILEPFLCFINKKNFTFFLWKTNAKENAELKLMRSL